MTDSKRRPIRRLLVANRGEIATRILATSRELDIETFAVYTKGDASHTRGADHAVELSSPASYMSIDEILAVAKKHQVDAIHPGYGFLSESEDFAARLWDEGGIVVIGPGPEILSRTGDKLKARALAEECNVPVCPGILDPTDNVQHIKEFASKNGYPVMVKAVDGGGGRGIRLVRNESELESNVKRAIEESPSKKVFVERAAIDGFRHIEVQIIGDGSGNVQHLWERECSIQRRYQKIIEQAPSSFKDRALAEEIIQSAMKMAKHVKYLSLGTFEFLANPSTGEYFFLEVNPRLQVEHTITECISLTDLVRVQLLIAQGASLADVNLPDVSQSPPLHAIQLRITAENIQSNWSLSIGKIQDFQFPSGNGIRVDTHLLNKYQAVVSSDFDSLIAKLVVTGSTWETVVRKAKRALDETQINGVHTNLDVLRAIVARPEFLRGECDTQWLESNSVALLDESKKISQSSVAHSTQLSSSHASSSAVASAGNMLFRKGDAWSLTLTPRGQKVDSDQAPHHLEIARVLRNEFPSSLAAEVVFTTPGTKSSQAKQVQYAMELSSTTASSAAATSTHRRGNPSDPSHVVIPFPGKLVEVLVDEGDEVHKGDVICVVQQMKMELEVRCSRSGRITWMLEAEEGEEIGENTLACIVERQEGARL
ncbi:hypothetical protein EJ05DRAFT_283268 [Pseudovirgaria hyperparasitica]|uniref:Uncharacterized protein n=1 Tax=Pseudovirgaria hyperparasitica TaxID=470096 RepID=A0A6A6WC36_9PEZI|nr:uncharacterized protein EJ05DRAFT_283268 [Pseudovirgaria hyperparasitica]KAF2760402.1 hypothetical protein EJ05DRAFT_283268 [Pseudovirgaria hyperparasitica]